MNSHQYNTKSVADNNYYYELNNRNDRCDYYFQLTAKPNAAELFAKLEITVKMNMKNTKLEK